MARIEITHEAMGIVTVTITGPDNSTESRRFMSGVAVFENKAWKIGTNILMQVGRYEIKHLIQTEVARYAVVGREEKDLRFERR